MSLKHVKIQCNKRLGDYPREDILTIDGIKQDGKVEAPWISVANAAREAKKRLARVFSKCIS